MSISSLYKSEKPFVLQIRDQNGAYMYEQVGDVELPYTLSLSNPNKNVVVEELTNDFSKRKSPSEESTLHYWKDVIVECLEDWQIFEAVSYTHLTLPTSYSV